MDSYVFVRKVKSIKAPLDALELKSTKLFHTE